MGATPPTQEPHLRTKGNRAIDKNNFCRVQLLLNLVVGAWCSLSPARVLTLFPSTSCTVDPSTKTSWLAAVKARPLGYRVFREISLLKINRSEKSYLAHEHIEQLVKISYTKHILSENRLNQAKKLRNS